MKHYRRYLIKSKNILNGKHDIRVQSKLPRKTEEEFLKKTVELKTFNSFHKWEKTYTGI